MALVPTSGSDGCRKGLKARKMDFKTKYLGLLLNNPLIAAASPLTASVNSSRLLEDAGAAAVVLPSLFEEQLISNSIEIDERLNQGTYSYPESLTYLPEIPFASDEAEQYLDLVRKSKEALSIPVIASLNGYTPGGWLRYAKEIQQAGADALELNIYYLAANPDDCCESVDQRYLDLISAVKSVVQIPLAVKVGPYFNAFTHIAGQMKSAGADALVLFNRFYQPDLDVETLSVTSNIVLSTSEDLRLRLHWVAILFGKLQADLAITGGVHNHIDVLKSIMAGANVTQFASALLQKGIPLLTTILAELADWMEAHEYHSIEQMRGSLSQNRVSDPTHFERVNYTRMISAYRQ
jgi:dihydroorotate dehydrogenase (fumarate)